GPPRPDRSARESWCSRRPPGLPRTATSEGCISSRPYNVDPTCRQSQICERLASEANSSCEVELHHSRRQCIPRAANSDLFSGDARMQPIGTMIVLTFLLTAVSGCGTVANMNGRE